MYITPKRRKSTAHQSPQRLQKNKSWEGKKMEQAFPTLKGKQAKKVKVGKTWWLCYFLHTKA